MEYLRTDDRLVLAVDFVLTKMPEVDIDLLLGVARECHAHYPEQGVGALADSIRRKILPKAELPRQPQTKEIRPGS